MVETGRQDDEAVAIDEAVDALLDLSIGPEPAGAVVPAVRRADEPHRTGWWSERSPA